MSPKACRVCAHIRRADIEHALYLTQRSERYIALCVGGLSRRDLKHHKYRCSPLPHTCRRMVEKLVRRGHAETQEEAERQLQEAGI